MGLRRRPGPVRPALFHVTTFATGLEHPWGAAFLPDGRLLVTERPGRMRLVDRDGHVSAPLGGVPPVEVGGWEGGLLDVALAPDFAATREIYFCHTALVQGGALTRLARARLSLDATALEGATPILDVTPAQRSIAAISAVGSPLALKTARSISRPVTV